MAAEQQGPTGPDLKQGIPARDVSDGGMLAGHADGEAVLLARRGGAWFAIAAHCSHYSGPLAEGLMVGDTVRCPWHHACFNLRTGQPLRPPALNDLPTWEVEQRGDRVFVGAKRAPAKPASSRRGAPDRVVIIGGGAAGDSAAETLRREGYAGSITVVDPDRDAPYDRPNLSKDYLAGTAEEEWIPLHPPEFYQERGIELRRGPKVAAIDPKGRRVRLDDGSDLPAWTRPSKPAHPACTISEAWRTAAGSRAPRARAAARSCSARASSGWRWRPRSGRARWRCTSWPRTSARWLA